MLTNKKTNHYIIQMLIFVITFIISKTLLKDVYLFEWASRRYFLYLWILVLLLTYFEKYRLSYAITISNTVGLFIGQYIGDLIIKSNQALITPETSNAEIARLNTHYGVLIWIGFVVVSMIAVLLFTTLTKPNGK